LQVRRDRPDNPNCVRARLLNPNLADAYYNRAAAYRKQGKRAPAQIDFDRAKKLGYPPQ